MTLSADELKELRVKAERSMFVVSLPTRTALSLIQAAELNAELVGALERLSSDLHSELLARYGDDHAHYPGIRRKFDADMEVVNEARALISKAKGSAGHD